MSNAIDPTSHPSAEPTVPSTFVPALERDPEIDLDAPRCPTWCGKPDGHYYDSESPSREATELRYHRLEIGEMRLPGLFVISIASLEQRDLWMGEPGEEGYSWKRWRPSVDARTDLDLSHLTADQAQQLADLLHSAAVRLDEIEEAGR